MTIISFILGLSVGLFVSSVIFLWVLGSVIRSMKSDIDRDLITEELLRQRNLIGVRTSVSLDRIAAWADRTNR